MSPPGSIYYAYLQESKHTVILEQCKEIAPLWLCTKTHEQYICYAQRTLFNSANRDIIESPDWEFEVKKKKKWRKQQQQCEVPQYLGDLSGDEIDSMSYEDFKTKVLKSLL